MIKRVLEPELMDEWEQARAYAAADFEAPHSRLVTLFAEFFPGVEISGHILDLGCGPGDVSFRFARRFPAARLTGVDGSGPMIHLAEAACRREAGLSARVNFVHGLLPGVTLPPGPHALILSTSFLHHLAHPEILWQTIRQEAGPGTAIFVVDLLRPRSKVEATRLVETYCGKEPEILKHDFYHSLLAAFTIEEIRAQLTACGLPHLQVKAVSDRHLAVYGIAPCNFCR